MGYGLYPLHMPHLWATSIPDSFPWSGYCGSQQLLGLLTSQLLVVLYFNLLSIYMCIGLRKEMEYSLVSSVWRLFLKNTLKIITTMGVLFILSVSCLLKLAVKQRSLGEEYVGIGSYSIIYWKHSWKVGTWICGCLFMFI